MTQNIETFNHEQFGSLRAVTNGQEPMFVAADACRSLDIKNPTDAIARLDDDEKARLNLGLPGGDTNVITFPGLLNLVLGSRKPEARAYKRWVTHEVLPSIHRTGGYMVAGADEAPEETMARALLIAKEAMERKDARIAALEDKGKQDAIIIEAQGNVIGEMAPKAIFADAVATSKTNILIGQLAKILRQNGVKDMGQNRLFEWMRREGYLGKSGSNYNVPLQKYIDMGLFAIKETAVAHSDGHTTVNITPKVTGKGQQYFVNKFLRGEE